MVTHGYSHDELSCPIPSVANKALKAGEIKHVQEVEHLQQELKVKEDQSEKNELLRSRVKTLKA